MLTFCPVCANVLVVEEGPRCMRFACDTCPYVQNITRTVSNLPKHFCIFCNFVCLLITLIWVVTHECGTLTYMCV